MNINAKQQLLVKFPTPFFAPQPHAVNKIAYISVPKNKTCSGLETQRKWLLLATTRVQGNNAARET